MEERGNRNMSIDKNKQASIESFFKKESKPIKQNEELK